MTCFADASFLVAFFSSDVHSRRARRWWDQHANPLLRTSRLAYFEAENSIRALRVAARITPEEELRSIETMKRYALEGYIELWETPVKRLFPSARRLSQFHSTDRSFGAMDILHVAGALDMKATYLLTFDQRQHELAIAEGLKAAPL
jgi:predicted nucleic acid-binding protein